MSTPSDIIDTRFRGVVGAFKLDVEFRAPMRGITAIFGPSGSGKTLVLRCVAGLHRMPGQLRIGGETWQDENGLFREPYRRAVGYVFQEASLFPHLTVRKNLLYGRDRAAKARIEETILLDDVVKLMGVGPLLDRSTASLSGGERQRAAIGRALLSQPRLLLMDEPLSALDRQSKEEILPYFEALHETLSIPILYVSHDISEVERLADSVVLLENGRVLASGPLPAVLSNAGLPTAQGPDAAVVVEAQVRAFDERYAITEMDLDGETLFVPGAAGTPGRTRRIRIHAADVSLSPERPSRTSILNVLKARIVDTRPVDRSQVNVVLTVGHGAGRTRLLARVSRRAYETLAFQSGNDIFIQVKAVSLIEPGLRT